MSDRTGRGVRIAVIDSGVNAQHPHIEASVAGGVAILPGPTRQEGDFTDCLGHGTAVMAAIQEKAPGAEYFALRVFHEALKTNAACLIDAIDWAIEHRVHVVNLSLGTVNMAHTERFNEAVARATEQNVIIVAARDAYGEPCLPGSLPEVLGVGLDWELDREKYRVEGIGTETLFFASGYPRSAPGVPLRRNLHGISFAVANMTGFVARCCEGLAHRSLGTVREILIADLTGA